jgi:hypothetical protein
MRLNTDISFMLRVFLNCVYLLYYATCCLFPKKLRKSVPESRETQFRAFVLVQHLYGKSGLGIFCEACGD